MNFKEIGSRILAVILSVLLCNIPQFAAAQTPANQGTQSSQSTQDQTAPDPRFSSAPADQQETPAQETPAQDPRFGSTRPDPSQAPLQPVPSARRAGTSSEPPDAPSAVQNQQQPTETSVATQSTQPQRPQNPLGTATAQEGVTRGGAASKPAGTAIAPAKQRQVRSLLIKLGLVAAGAVAVGTVVGLTRSTSSIPPGAH